MVLREVMNRRRAAIPPGTPLREAARRLSARHGSVLPVCDQGRLVGLLSLHDLIMRATAQGCDPRTGTVREVMTREFISGREDQELVEALALMRRHRLSELPVLDGEHRLVGMLSLRHLQDRN